jgi:hypothetical protein
VTSLRIAELAKLLDGLPLAIELAAARVRVMSPQSLVERMSERFKLLASTGRRQDRQATLRATFDWSWDLLAPSDKSALAQLSVFDSGFTLESAEAVVDLQGCDDAPWVADAVHSLVDKSLVRQLPNERFDLLASVQEYGWTHLRGEGRFPGSGPGAQASAEERHYAHFGGFDAERAIANRCADLDNLAAACLRAAARGASVHAAGALRGAWAAPVAWTVQGRCGASFRRALYSRVGAGNAREGGRNRRRRSRPIRQGSRGASPFGGRARLGAPSGGTEARRPP